MQQVNRLKKQRLRGTQTLSNRRLKGADCSTAQAGVLTLLSSTIYDSVRNVLWKRSKSSAAGRISDKLHFACLTRVGNRISLLSKYFPSHHAGTGPHVPRSCAYLYHHSACSYRFLSPVRVSCPLGFASNHVFHFSLTKPVQTCPFWPHIPPAFKDTL